MPSQPPIDRRNSTPELGEDEIRARIEERAQRARRTRNHMIGGLLIGIVGLVVAGYAGLVDSNIWMTLVGFAMALIGFGFTTFKEAGTMARELLGRGGSK